MKTPINVEETPARVVGRRTNVTNPFAAPQRTAADAERWRKAFGGLRIPRGVHRFDSHEAADKWLWEKITSRPRN
jgi:hypothetical protein